MHSQIAIIGNGVSTLTALSVFQAEGLRPEPAEGLRPEPAEGLDANSIAVYGDQTDPLANLRRYTRAIQQDRMRSESSGHFFPSDFPGMALLDSLRGHTPLPLLLSLFDLYQPRLDDLLAHGEQITSALKGGHAFVRTRVARVWYDGNGGYHLFDGAGAELGRAQHVLLALGHPGLRWPEPLVSWRTDKRVAHTYQTKHYLAGETVLVVGSGMAAAHEWRAALRAGCRVVALSRNPFRHQPLNAQRCDFSAAGLDRYRRLKAPERHAFLDRVASGSYPWRFSWEREFARARRSGSWRHLQAELLSVAADGETLAVCLSNGKTASVHRIIAATGFIGDVMAHPLIAQLASDYPVPVERGRLMISDDFTLPLVGSAHARIGVIGTLARWALPVADTFVGMKYVARRIRRTMGISSQSLHRIQFNLRLMRGQP